jgi:hypothetical protein
MNDGTNSADEQREVENAIADYLVEALEVSAADANTAAVSITRVMLKSYRPDLLIHDTSQHELW